MRITLLGNEDNPAICLSSQEPVIDATSNEGEIPDHLEGNIEFRDIVFRYPARPDVQVNQHTCTNHTLYWDVKKINTHLLYIFETCLVDTALNILPHL